MFYAPHVNSYKRFADGSFAPTAVAWGNDNRTCSLRVVGHGEALRFENRLPGADVNPYLALAAMIAAGLHGVDSELALEPPLEGNAYTSDKPHVPTNLYEARDLFAASDVAREAFGQEVVDHYLNRAQVELEALEARSPTGSSSGASSGSEGGPPAIGITAAVERARWAVWDDVEVNISQRTYTRRVDAAGGLPLLLPTTRRGRPSRAPCSIRSTPCCSPAAPTSTRRATAPSRTRGPTNTRRERDAFELALARAALERDMPVLGICRGIQILNVALGGTLDQHLADAELHLHTPGRFGDHEVRLEPGSLAAQAAGAERLSVRSHHHQGIGRLGDGLVASGWAEPGGVIEAIELPDPALGARDPLAPRGGARRARSSRRSSRAGAGHRR